MNRVRSFAWVLIAGIVSLTCYRYGPELIGSFNKIGGSVQAAKTRSESQHKSSISEANSLSVQTSSTPSVLITTAVSNDTAVNEFLQSSNFAATYAKLAKLVTPHALFVMAHIQDLCRRVAEVEKEGIPDPRELPIVGTENVDLRLQAQMRLRERSSRRLCQNFPLELLTDQSIKGAYERASAAGDVRAKLRDLEERLVAERVSITLTGNATPRSATPDSGVGVAPRLSTNDFALLRSAFESRDPTAIRAAGPLLAGLYRDTEISFGNMTGPVDGVIGDAVWSLLACKYGAGCDASSNELNEACLLNARCGDSTLQDYFVRYALKPEQMQEVLALVARFQGGIDQGDWAFLQIKPNANFKFDRTPFPPAVRPFVLRP